MFARRTVFVIGAGCSFEYGLPVGNGLRNEIVKLLDGLVATPQTQGDHVLRATIDELVDELGEQDEAQWFAAAKRIARGVSFTSSIDRFLDMHQDDEKVVRLGKLAIVQAIAAAEARCSLATSSGHLNLQEIAQRSGGGHDWLGHLFRHMQEGLRRETIHHAFKNVTFICFNYDRCIEHYLYHAVKDLCAFDDSEAAIALNHLRILHPYGRVGAPEWSALKGSTLRLRFGDEVDDPRQLIQLAKGIKTFTEKVEEDDELHAIHTAMMDCEQVIFLGFSFLDQNMELLSPNGSMRATIVRGTSYGESESNRQIAHRLTVKMLDGRSGGQRPPMTLDLASKHVTAGQFMNDFANELRR